MIKIDSLFLLAHLALFAFVLILIPGCEKDNLFIDDLSLARAAYDERKWSQAERLLERYLRDEQNPDKRWDAWELLLKAINANHPESRASLECLEAMLAEYDGNEPRVAEILIQMGRFNELLRRYDRAANAWSAYLELSSLDNPQRVEGYRRLAAMQSGRRQFEAGEDSLQQCLSLPLPDHDKIPCMLDLADLYIARERWQEAADLCQQIQDAKPDRTIQGIVGYLRGDALEQMGQTEEALKQFEMARDDYPNPAVMDNRISCLKKNIRNKTK